MAVAMTAGGCISKDDLQPQKTPVPIRLTASVGMEAVTRGADGKVIETDAVITRGIQENALASGETVYAWANEAGGSTWDYLKAWTLTVDGSGDFTGSTKYYPPDGTAITMNAVHGNFSETLTEDETAVGTLTHSVVANQSAEGGYEKSDLLFGTATGSKASTSAENIDFTHKLSKIEVNLTAGYGYTSDDLATAIVRLNNVLPTVTINPTDGTLGSASGTALTVTTRKNATTDTYEAVIPPQTFANPDALIAVTTTKDDLTLTSTVPNDVATYASDTRYVYAVRIDKPVTNLAELKAFVAGGYDYSEYIGYYVNSIGAISTSTADAIGVIGELYKNGNEGGGLILALKDATSQTWATINGWTSVSKAGKTVKLLPNNSARGSLTSYTLLGSVSVSNWAVAEVSDYSEMFRALGTPTSCTYGYVYDSKVNARLTACSGGTGLSDKYWSATLGNATEGYGVWFNNSTWGQYYSNQSYKVRPVIAF